MQHSKVVSSLIFICVLIQNDITKIYVICMGGVLYIYVSECMDIWICTYLLLHTEFYWRGSYSMLKCSIWIIRIRDERDAEKKTREREWNRRAVKGLMLWMGWREASPEEFNSDKSELHQTGTFPAIWPNSEQLAANLAIILNTRT